MLAVLASVVVAEETMAVLVRLPAAPVVTVMVTVAPAALARFPRAQFIAPLSLLVQLPWLVVTVTKLTPAGNWSVTIASGTEFGPPFATVSV